MVSRLLIVAVCLAAAATATPSAQSDLDALMSRVMSRRDDNWKKLQQYTLNQRDTLQVTALAVFRLYGFEREYFWFPRSGFFIRSPLKADGVAIGEDERRRQEERWLRSSQSREKRRAERAKQSGDPDDADTAGPGDIAVPESVDDLARQSFEPGFISSANFLKFTFDPGQYALSGREKMLDRDVLKIEYYPTKLFRDNDDERRRRDQPRSEREVRNDQKGQEIEADMNKTSLVTLWIDPAENQILRYEFRNVDMDFLPARWLVRMDRMQATMQMAEPFPNVWLPASMNVRFRMTLPLGPIEARYDVKYSNYKLAETSGRIVP